MKPVLPRMASAVLPVSGREVADEKVSAGLRVLAGLPASLRNKVKVVSVDKAGQVSLSLTNGPFVRLGAEERLVAKVLSLRAVLAAYQRAGNRTHVHRCVQPGSTPGEPAPQLVVEGLGRLAAVAAHGTSIDTPSKPSVC